MPLIRRFFRFSHLQREKKTAENQFWALVNFCGQKKKCIMPLTAIRAAALCKTLLCRYLRPAWESNGHSEALAASQCQDVLAAASCQPCLGKGLA